MLHKGGVDTLVIDIDRAILTEIDGRTASMCYSCDRYIRCSAKLMSYRDIYCSRHLRIRTIPPAWRPPSGGFTVSSKEIYRLMISRQPYQFEDTRPGEMMRIH